MQENADQNNSEYGHFSRDVIAILTKLSKAYDRSSRPEVFCKKGVLRNFAKFTGNYLCQSLFFDKDAGLRPATLLKKRHWHRCFPMNYVKYLRTPFFIEHLWWLLLLYVPSLIIHLLRWSVVLVTAFFRTQKVLLPMREKWRESLNEGGYPRTFLANPSSKVFSSINHKLKFLNKCPLSRRHCLFKVNTWCLYC